MVIEPLLIDEDYYARVEGREIISNLAKVFIFLEKKVLYLLMGLFDYRRQWLRINVTNSRVSFFPDLLGCWFGYYDLYHET